MKINYKLTNSDFLQYQLYTSSKSETHKKRRRNSRVVVPILFLLYGFYLTNRDESYGGIIAFGFTSVLWFFLYPKYSKWRYERYFKKHVEDNYKNRIDNTVELDFDENYISTKDFTSESKINGAEIKELIETQNHFFIKLATDLSLIVPKHAVTDQEELKKRITDFGANYNNELSWVWK
ncbi:YcxB family protein [Flagellimonas sp. S174]|uniref:YcxB family protein n=1 Tax=Flagellimonas sp. S174 TaxID=3410790 RepID=UPI003BF57E2E